MNNWPNPNVLGEPKFPDIARPHFLSYVADASVYEGIPGYVKQDTLLVGLWNPESRQWLLMTGDTAATWEIALECGYISPCYTEEEMQQAKLDIFDACINRLEILSGTYRRYEDYGASQICDMAVDKIIEEKDKI